MRITRPNDRQSRSGWMTATGSRMNWDQLITSPILPHGKTMTLDEITSALKLPDTTPLAALRAGVDKTDELAPLVFAIADKLCRGVYLLQEENDLLFYGLHILAA